MVRRGDRRHDRAPRPPQSGRRRLAPAAWPARPPCPERDDPGCRPRTSRSGRVSDRAPPFRRPPREDPGMTPDADTPSPPHSGTAPASEAVPRVAAAAQPTPPAPKGPSARRWDLRRRVRWIAGGVLVVATIGMAVPSIRRSLVTVSTDDAYVNGHVTLVAPRVPGQVARVLVDDNNRVRKGDLLVQLDREPYEVQVAIAQAAVAAAQADIIATQAKVRGLEGLARSQRFNLAHAMENLDNEVAELRSRAATLPAKRATLARARADYERERPLAKEGAVSKQELDAFTEAVAVAQA